jgi:hypothetical protein
MGRVAVVAVLLLASCQQFQAKPNDGQVIGLLTKPDGSHYPAGASVFAVTDGAKDTHSDLQFKTNEKGRFAIEKLNAGRYGLWMVDVPPADNQPGIDNLPIPLVGRIISKGNPVVFAMPEKGGLDLGTIEVSEVSR